LLPYFRSERTELLSDDLQSSEKKVELVKLVSTNTGKKVQGSLLGAGASDVDKRLVCAYIFSL